MSYLELALMGAVFYLWNKISYLSVREKYLSEKVDILLEYMRNTSSKVSYSPYRTLPLVKYERVFAPQKPQPSPIEESSSEEEEPLSKEEEPLSKEEEEELAEEVSRMLEELQAKYENE